MLFHYILLEDAQEDYENALGWYAERSVQAAERFIEAMDEVLQSICEHPDRWRNSYKNFHELELKTFHSLSSTFLSPINS